LAVGLWLIIVGWGSVEPPTSWTIVGSQLKVVDPRGRQVFQYTFSFPLAAAGPNNPDQGQFVDLHGDGTKELILVNISQGDVNTRKVFCFSHTGELLWQYQRFGSVKFGKVVYEGPFSPTRFAIVQDEGGGASVVIASVHPTEFPTLVERLDHSGNVRGTYWATGHIEAMAVGNLDGRRVLVLGGVSNDLGQRASLAVVDYENVTGSAPTTNEAYRCGSCPTAEPRAYVVFPQQELWRIITSNGPVNQIHILSESGNIDVGMVVRNHQLHGLTRPLGWSVHYLLNNALEVLKASFGSGYDATHNVFWRVGEIDHRFDPDHVRDLLPVQRWKNGQFVEDWGR
jgi:hypothetical protein